MTRNKTMPLTVTGNESNEGAAMRTKIDVAEDIGKKAARIVFARRGNHSEVHLSEAELAALFSEAVGIALWACSCRYGKAEK